MNGWTLARLVHALRQAGVSISTQDIKDTQICLQCYPNISEKLIAGSLLIHCPQDYSIFETVWRIIRDHHLIEVEKNSSFTRSINSQLSLENRAESDIGGQGVGEGWGGISLTHMGSLIDATDISAQIPRVRIEELVSSSDVQFEECVNVVLSKIDYFSWINSYDLAYQRGECHENEWDQHLENRSCLLQEIRQLILSVQITLENSWQPLVRQHWMLKSLSLLTEDEKALVKSCIRRWARKLAIRPGLRWKASRRGTIDITQIVQQSVQWNGVLFQLRYRQRSLRSSELIVLCDISNSMAAYVEFMIYLVICMRNRFRKIRVFFFIDSLWDISDLDWSDDQNLKQEIKSWGHKVSSGYSDYGAVFQELAEIILKNTANRANLVILGDAKNNFRPAQVEHLALIADHVKKIFWLNPLIAAEWNDRDNKMREYQNYCTKVYQCHSASDLKRIVREVF